MQADIRAGQVSHQGRVTADLTDINGHMNVLSFDRIFDIAETDFFLTMGIGAAYVTAFRQSLFRLEKRVVYEHELLEGEAFEVRSWICAFDGRRIHHLHELWDVDRDRRCAFYEGLTIHVDLTARKSTPITTPQVREAFHAMALAQARHGLPQGPQDRGIGPLKSLR